MSWINRLLGSFRKNNLEEQLDDELQFHLEMRTQEFIAAGMTPEEARCRAQRLFGNQLLLKERTRDMDTIGWIETLWQDLRYAVRMLSKSPGFTAVAITTLALGIGANTAIFSLMNALVLRPMRVQNPDQLVMITETKLKEKKRRVPTMAAMLEWKKHSQTLQDLSQTGFYGDPVTLSGIGRAERVNEGYCATNFFSMLGVKPFRGQLFLQEIQKGQGTTVVISENLWRRTFAADPSILGQTVVIAGNKKTIVGVLPPGFSILPWDMHIDVWLAIDPAWSLQIRWLPKIGRLKPGVTLEQAQAELAAIAHGMEQRQDADAEWSIRLEPLQKGFVGEVRGYFYLLLGAVGFILLIACANVANLLLARGAVRQREMAIRASLGAARWRLIRQLLAEATLLALLGGGIGVLIGFWGMRILISAAPMEWIRSVSLSLDLRVLAFTLGVSVLTGVLFGLLPAFRTSKTDLHESLKAVGRQSSGISRQRGQSFLLVSEIALAIVLLVGAGLMINSFIRMHKVDLGFNPRNVLSADIFLDGPKFWYDSPGKPGIMKTITPQGDIFYQQLLDRIERLPGVVAAGTSHTAPPGDIEQRTFRIIGRPAPASGQEAEAGYNEVSAGLFRSLDIPLLKGRYVAERDNEGSPWVVDINETLARRFFPNEDPIGKMIQTKILQGSDLTLEENRPREIVGVVGDVRHFGFGSDPFPIMYGSYHQHGAEYPGGTYSYHTWKSITLRTAANPMNLVVPLQKVVAEIDKDQALFEVKSMEQGLADSASFPRFQMTLFGIFGGLALVLAAVGIYGVMSYVVAQRTHEIGLRVALGARRVDVLRMVIGRGVKMTVIGLAAGIAASLALTRLIARFLFGVKNTDPVTYSIVALVLAAVALIACYVPARRATRVDPMVALRHE